MSGYGKYGAKPLVVDGVRFASTKEANRYSELKLLERGREIRNLTLQPAYEFRHNGVLIGRYVADFSYDERGKGGRWLPVVEDVKGVRTPVYQMKRKLMLAFFDIPIRET